MIGVIVALGPKANAEDTVNSDRKTVFLYLPNIKFLVSEWTNGIEVIVIVGSQVMSTC
jgi:hypothetical protein